MAAIKANNPAPILKMNADPKISSFFSGVVTSSLTHIPSSWNIAMGLNNKATAIQKLKIPNIWAPRYRATQIPAIILSPIRNILPTKSHPMLVKYIFSFLKIRYTFGYLCKWLSQKGSNFFIDLMIMTASFTLCCNPVAGFIFTSRKFHSTLCNKTGQ